MARTPLASLHHEDVDTEDESHMPQYGSERHKDPASLVTAKTGTILMRGRNNFLCWLTNLTLLLDFILLMDIVVTLKDNTPEGELSEPLWCPEMMRDRYKRAGRLKWGGVADAQQWPVGWLPFLGGAFHLVRTGHLTPVSWLGFRTTLDIILLFFFFWRRNWGSEKFSELFQDLIFRVFSSLNSKSFTSELLFYDKWELLTTGSFVTTCLLV